MAFKAYVICTLSAVLCISEGERTIAVERRSVQKLYSSTIALRQIFDLFFAGSQCYRFCDVTYVPYLLMTFYLSLTMSPP